MEAYFRQFTREKLATVEAIAMNMWEPYILATHACVPDAARKIVFDRYHATTQVTKPVDEVRRQEHKALKKARRFWATRSRLAPIIGAAKTLKRHLPNLLTYCTHRITTATADGINSKIQRLKLMACGYRNRKHFKTAIYFHCGGLDLYQRLETA